MKVVIGSKNPDKIKILKDAFREIHLEAEVIGVKADSKITNQPLGKKTTKKGAVNRARNAKKEELNADFWFGLEGGLHDYGEGYHLITFASLINKQSSDEFIGEGEEIHLPEEVSEKIKNGEWFGDVIREYAKDHEIDGNLITRLSPFTQAVQNAYAEYLRKYGNLGYRRKSSAIIFDENENFLIVQLVGYKPDDWNFSGGGIEKGETEEEAIRRELKEELGTDKFEIVKKTKETDRYEWPPFAIVKRLKEEGRTWRGQEVMFFLVKFVGDKEDIKPDPGEIRKIKWIRREEFEDHFHFPGQLERVSRVIKEFFT